MYFDVSSLFRCLLIHLLFRRLLHLPSQAPYILCHLILPVFGIDHKMTEVNEGGRLRQRDVTTSEITLLFESKIKKSLLFIEYLSS